MMVQDVMTAQQAAGYLQTSRDTIVRKARAGLLPAAKLGREWRFRKADLDAWLSAGGTARERLEDEGIAIVMAERMADPANHKFTSLAEFRRERGL